MQSLWMLVACILFACMGACVKSAAPYFSSGELVFYRGLIGVLLMMLIAYKHKISLKSRIWKGHLYRGIAGASALLCSFYAITVLPLATATTLNYTSPLFIALLLHFFFRESLKMTSWLVLIIGFIGIILLLQPSFDTKQIVATLIGALSGLLASIAYLSVRSLGKAGEPEIRTVFWFMVATTLFGLIWSLFTGFHSIKIIHLPLLLGVGLSAGFAQIALTRAFTYGNTLVSANLSYCTPIFATILGALLWQEYLTFNSMFGIILVITCSICMSIIKRR